jgi:hypothetical protein
LEQSNEEKEEEYDAEKYNTKIEDINNKMQNMMLLIN